MLYAAPRSSLARPNRMPSPRSLRLLAPLLVATLPAALSAQSPPPGFVYETLSVGGLDSATAMAFLPDGRLLLTERTTGNIRVFQDGQLQATPWATIPISSGPPIYTEQGLLGIAVDPAFLTNGLVYVFYTDPSGNENRISSLKEVNGVGTNLKVLSPNGAIPSTIYHNGGAMVFGIDGSLFVATGDGLSSQTSQNLGDWRGKTLRFEVPLLTVPANNPFAGSAVFSYGHRNHFGFAVHPITGVVYQTENGGGLMDEVNRLVSGGNYGWPTFEGVETTPNAATVDPIEVFGPPVGLTGTCFYHGVNYPAAYRDAWFFTDYNWSDVHMLRLDATGTRPVEQQLFDDRVGAGYAVTMGPDGNLWFLTNQNVGYGADEIGRYVHTSAPWPSLHAMSLSNKTLAGSLTVGITGKAGGVAASWMSLSRFGLPVPTPWGDAWVPPDVVSPLILIGNDDRGYHAWSVPNDPTLLNITIQLQGVFLSAQGLLRLTNPNAFVVRG